MKSYLQRLAARAEGVVATPSLVPSIGKQTASALDTREAFVEGEPLDIASPEKYMAHRGTSSPEPFGSDTRALLGSNPVESNSLEDHGNQRRETMSESRLIKPKIMEPVLSTASLVADAANHTAARFSSTRSASPTNELLTQRQVEGGTPGVRRTETPTPEKTDPAELALPIVPRMQSPPALEPRIGEPRRESLPDAPRLVIGQMRVDVIATAPPQTREVVRTVTRSVDPVSYSARANSKLRFGLRQM